MKGLATRVERLEAALPQTLDSQGQRLFWQCVAAQEAAFRLEHVNLTLDERMALPPAWHFAWCRRFANESDLTAVMRLYGWNGPPSSWGGYMLAMSVFIPGDEGL